MFKFKVMITNYYFDYFLKKFKNRDYQLHFCGVNTLMNKTHITLKIILRIKLIYEFFVLKKSILPKTPVSTQ